MEAPSAEEVLQRAPVSLRERFKFDSLEASVVETPAPSSSLISFVDKDCHQFVLAAVAMTAAATGGALTL